MCALVVVIIVVINDHMQALGHARNSNRLHCLGSFILLDTPANMLQVIATIIRH